MRALLVKPRSVSDSVQPPLGLGFLAACLDSHEVTIVDAILDDVGPNELPSLARSWEAAVVGFQLNSYDLRSCAAYLERLREQVPSVVTVVGGPHPTADPLGTFEFFREHLDYLFQGEAETGLRDLLDLLESGVPGSTALSRVPGLVWRDAQQRPHANPPGRTELRNLALPRWDLMDPRRYPPAPHSAFFRRFPVAPVSVSRGCPYSCTFCAGSSIHGHDVRYRSLDAVLEEIRLLYVTFGVREIHFIDDNLTFDTEKAHALCDGLLALPFRLVWSCPNGVRLDRLDRSLVLHMREAGCYAVGVGVESGSDRILRRIRKGLSLELIRRQVAMLHEAALQVRGFFVLGFPTETREEMNATVDFALELPLDLAHFMLFHPLPGTLAFEEVLGEHREFPIDWSAATLAEAAYAPAGLSLAEMKALQRRAFLRFFLRPRPAWTVATSVRGWRHGWWLVRRIARWLR